MNTETRDIVVREGGTAVAEQAQSQPMNILHLAVQQGASPEQLEKLLALQERHEANEARKAWVAAMAAFKADPPRISKDKVVEFSTQKGRTTYSHATLGNVTATVNAALSKHGLSASWETKQDAAMVTVTCRVTHVMGHFESTTLSAAPDNSGNKNSIQAVGSTVTYLERYTLLSILGLATYDQDDDGAAGAQTVEFITEAQVGIIRDLMAAHGADPVKLCSWLRVDSVEQIPAAWFKRVCDTIKQKRAA